MNSVFVKNCNLKKIMVVVAILATLIVMLASSDYLVEHMHHDCCGDECPVCAVMAQCVNNIKTISAAVIVVYAVLSLMISLFKDSCIISGESFAYSLISQKVRMNN